MSATSSAGSPFPHPLNRDAGRASVPGSGRGATGRARTSDARWYPPHDEAPRSGRTGGPVG
ncbi:transcriptional regulator, partial [Micromonospora chalcea]